MKDITHKNISNSNYIKFSKKGTLDARMPSSPDTERLVEVYNNRKKYLSDGYIFDLYLLPTKNLDKFVIADGKHRLALAVHLKKLSQVKLNYINKAVLNNIFFQKFYKKILEQSDQEYSINKKNILEII